MRVAYREDKRRFCKDCIARFGKVDRCFAGQIPVDGGCELTQKQVCEEMEKHNFDKRRLK